MANEEQRRNDNSHRNEVWRREIDEEYEIWLRQKQTENEDALLLQERLAQEERKKAELRIMRDKVLAWTEESVEKMELLDGGVVTVKTSETLHELSESKVYTETDIGSSLLMTRSSKIENPEKPWTVDQFEELRRDMTEFVRNEVVPLLNEDLGSNRLLIHGEVKVGKREVVEYISVRDSYNPTRIHVFISAFHRKSDEGQRDELEQHGINVFSVYNKKKQTEAITFVRECLDDGKFVVIHWDECDYGTGERQNLANIYKIFKKSPHVFNILYSATPEELLYSDDIASNSEDDLISDFYENGVVKKFTPPMGYCGAKKFIENDLVFQALPFFESSSCGVRLTEQGKSIIAQAKAELRKSNRRRRNLLNDREDAEDSNDLAKIDEINHQLGQIQTRNVIVLRLSYFEGDDYDHDENYDVSESCKEKAIHSFLKNSQHVEELEGVVIYADKLDVKEFDALPKVSAERIKWSNKQYWENMTKEKIVLVVHDQTATRSTEWVFHDRIYATHDYRKRLTFNTVAQAQLRCAHYEQNYQNKFQPINIYGDVKTWKFAIGLIDAAEYLTNEWFLRKIPKSNPPRWRIKNALNVQTILPRIVINVRGELETYGGSIPNTAGYSTEVAQKMLVQLGGTNNGGSKMSQRVKGSSKKIPITMSKFYPCEPHEKDNVLHSIHTDVEIMEYLGDYTFTGRNLFEYIDVESQQYKGYHRKLDVFTAEALKDDLWGIRIGREHARLTVCYNSSNQLGLLLRIATGETKEVNNLEAYKSMYQGI